MSAKRTAGASGGPTKQDSSEEHRIWQCADSVLERVLDLPPDERTGLVDRLCGQDEVLRERVLELLAADREMSQFLGSAPLSPSASPQTDPGLRVGDRVGPYRLTEVLGVGGMGWVFAADRADGEFAHSVAVKVLSEGLTAYAGAEPALAVALAERMRQERQILARLDHPNIARLLDGGTTGDGRPYLVMEKLEGSPIDRYCADHDLGIAARLRLFRRVCSAVQFAHVNLLVHRDLKPSNVLVTNAGVPKLLDFGIAKLLDLEGQSSDLLTRTGESPMTLRYASPEQAMGQPLTTACDVYSLGVLLYELLSGHSPYGDPKGSYELMRAICEQVPESPSNAVLRRVDDDDEETLPRQEADASPKRNAAKSGETARGLRGDLDAIVLKALEKDPSRRYASAEALADDLSRHLTRLPVRARQSTIGYRLAAFGRRHRMALAIVGLLLTVNFGYLAALSSQARRIQQESDDSREALDFLIWTFQQANAMRTGQDVTGKQILDQGTAQLESSFGDRPRVRGRLLLALSEAYLGMSFLDRSEETLQARFALEGSGGLEADGPEIWVRLHRHRAAIASAREQLEEAEQAARMTLARGEAALGVQHDETLRTRQLLASILTATHDFDEAKALFDDVSTALAERLPERHPWRLLVMRELATHFQLRGMYTEAKEILHRLFETEKAMHGEGHLNVGLLYADLGSIALFQGDDAEALPLCKRAQEILRPLLGEGHTIVATLAGNLATALSNLGELDEAEALYRDSLALRKERFGADHPSVGNVLNNLASVLRRKGDYPTAEAHLREALDIFEAHHGPRGGSAAWVQCGLGKVIGLQGRFAEATERLERCQELMIEVYTDPGASLAWPLIGFGEIAMLEGRPEDAEPRFRRALALRRAKDDIGAERLAVAAGLLGDCLLVLKRHAEAEPLLRERLDRYQELLPIGHTLRVAAAQALVDLYRQWDPRGELEAVSGLLETERRAGLGAAAG